jgi:hypothetical protein
LSRVSHKSRYYVLATTGYSIYVSAGKQGWLGTSYSVYDSVGMNEEVGRFTPRRNLPTRVCRARAFALARELNAAKEAETLPEVLLARAHA